MDCTVYDVLYVINKFIKALILPPGVAFLDNVSLGSAREGYISNKESATNVEQCVCSNGHLGQFCESCMNGFKREEPFGGPFSRCVPCECNSHSDACDIESGKLLIEYCTICSLSVCMLSIVH